jgi:hypothetical protein
VLINKDIPAERCIGLLKAPHPRVVLFPRQHADGGPRFLALAALYAPEHSPRGEKGAAPTSGDRQSRGMFRVFVVVDSTSKVAVGSMSTGRGLWGPSLRWLPPPILRPGRLEL